LPRDGITLATASATDDAIVATTPFFDLLFVFEPPDRFAVAFDLGAALLDDFFDFVFALDFFAAFLAIADSATPRGISTQKLPNKWRRRRQKKSRRGIHPGGFNFYFRLWPLAFAFF
jgi:hypothetical protein